MNNLAHRQSRDHPLAWPLPLVDDSGRLSRCDNTKKGFYAYLAGVE
jgi:hypothetical protein